MPGRYDNDTKCFCCIGHYQVEPAIQYSDTTTYIVNVYPTYTTTYNIELGYANGCIVDTSITVTVSKVQADAGLEQGTERWR